MVAGALAGEGSPAGSGAVGAARGGRPGGVSDHDRELAPEEVPLPGEYGQFSFPAASPDGREIALQASGPGTPPLVVSVHGGPTSHRARQQTAADR